MAEWITRFLDDPLLDQMILQMTAVGGVLITGLGINLLHIATIRVADLLPALPLAAVGAVLTQFLQ